MGCSSSQQTIDDKKTNTKEILNSTIENNSLNNNNNNENEKMFNNNKNIINEVNKEKNIKPNALGFIISEEQFPENKKPPTETRVKERIILKKKVKLEQNKRDKELFQQLGKKYDFDDSDVEDDNKN